MCDCAALLLLLLPCLCSIIANKYPDVYAACVENAAGAANAAAINNANVLTLGAKLLKVRHHNRASAMLFNVNCI